MMRARLSAWLAAALIAFADTTAHAGPQRIVSLNLCADELVLRIAAPGTVKSITWLARDASLSNVADLAQHVGINKGSAEEIVPMQPDLVIAGAYTTRMTTALLKRLDIPLLELGVANSIDQALGQIELVAAALGRSEQGAELIGHITSRMAALPAAPAVAEQPLAAIYQPNGFTIGQGSLVDDLMRRAGVRNLAVERHIDHYGSLPLESLLRAQPDFLIMNTADDQTPAMAYEILRHPALLRSYQAARVINIPSAWWSCPGPRLVDAVQRLQQAAQQFGSRAATAPR
jgi:iron complex transport system substrate-binding protein